MKKQSYFLIVWMVFVAAASTLPAKAAYFDRYHGDLAILNQTPFTLKIVKHFMEKNKRGDKGQFYFSEPFQAQDFSLIPGEVIHLGYGESRTNKIEGHFIFDIVDTDQSFDAHYRFAKDKDTDTWIKLKQLSSQEPYPFVSIRMMRSCKVTKRLISGTDYQHTCTVTFTMDEAAASCIGDPNCTAEDYQQKIKSAKIATIQKIRDEL